MAEIYRLENKSPHSFAMVSNWVMRSPTLSLQAKGLYAILCGFSDGYELDLGKLHDLSTNGRDATHKARKELNEEGLISFNEARTESGTFRCRTLVINNNPRPLTENPLADNPLPENHELVSRNPSLYSKNINNNNPPIVPLSAESELFQLEPEYSPDSIERFLIDFPVAWNEAAAKSVCKPGLAKIAHKAGEPPTLNAIRESLAKSLHGHPSAIIERWRDALAFLASSPFHCGANKRGWVASVNWFLKPESIETLLEQAATGKRKKSAVWIEHDPEDNKPF